MSETKKYGIGEWFFFCLGICGLAVFVIQFIDIFSSLNSMAKPLAENTAESEDTAVSGNIATEFILGDLGDKIRKERNFTYPESMEIIEDLAQKSGGWIPQPIFSPYDLAYNFFNPDRPHLTPEEAAALKNDSPEANQKIIEAYQRFPDRKNMKPEQDCPEIDYDAELHRHISADATSFNPLFFNSTADAEIISYTQAGLLTLRLDTMEYVGSADTIVSWVSSADHKMDKIIIRDDLLWSDGTPVTAYDFEFSYDVIMSSAVPIAAVRSGTDMLLGVKAYDERTLVFFHQEPSPISPLNISYYVIPKHIYEKSIYEDPTLVRTPYHQKQEHNPVTSGPYVVEKHMPQAQIVLKRRENYHLVNGKQVREKSFFNRIHFQISPDSATAFMQMRNGDIEVMDFMPEQWLTQATTDEFYEKNTKASASSWTYFALWFNLSKDCPFFQDIRVRQALSYAFDYDEMLKVHRKGLDIQCRGNFAESAPFFPKNANLEYMKQDYAKARELLREAGWIDTDRDGILDHEWKGKRIPFSFTIQTSNKPERIELCNLFSRCLRHLGIECTVQSMEFNVMCQRQVQHKFEMYMGGWGAGADPYSGQNIWGTGEGRNFISYSNPEVDRLYAEGLREFNRQKRVEIYQKIHMHLYQDYPCIWLYNLNASTGFNKKLRGVGFYYRGANLSSTWKEAVK